MSSRVRAPNNSLGGAFVHGGEVTSQVDAASLVVKVETLQNEIRNIRQVKEERHEEMRAEIKRLKNRLVLEMEKNRALSRVKHERMEEILVENRRLFRELSECRSDSALLHLALDSLRQKQAPGSDWRRL